MPGRSGETAKLLILIGLIFQVITVFVLFVVGLVVSFILFIGGIILLLAFLGLIFVVLVYVFSYARARDGDYEGARTPTLVFGILSLISLGVISGILYVIAFTMLGPAADEDPWGSAQNAEFLAGGVRQDLNAPTYPPGPSQGTAYALPFPPVQPTAQAKTVYCTNCGQPAQPQARFCRNCGSRLL